ncbi:MAG: TonB-dependent receptor plug domain-containing protein [Paludibacter sp.]|nr:TonB-dependent receptor plug domain-containing protein [Paludibacter sp.]
MKKILEIVLICCLLSVTTTAQQQQFYRLRGQVIDVRTQKPVKRVPIRVLPYDRIVEADAKGAFIFEMPKGQQELIIDYEPFDKQHLVINLQQDTAITIALYSPFDSQYIEEVEVVSAARLTENPASVKRIDAHVLEKLPVMLGERDIMKAFALTSGVSSGSEGSSEIQVRGGNHGQNLFLLDGIPLYSTMHAFGMVSVYNPVIIKSARLYKSFFPAEFGGKLSSVVNVITKEPNTRVFSGEAEIGLLSSKLSLNVPLIKDKLGWQVSGRIANYALANFTNLFFDPDDTKLGLHFADLNSSLFWKANAKNRFRLNFFHNSDGIDVGQTDINVFNSLWIKNTQQNISGQWLQDFSARLKGQMLVYADRYIFDLGNSQKNKGESFSSINQILSGVNTLGAEEKMMFKLSDQQQLHGGLFLKNSTFSPIQWIISDTTTQRSNYLRQSAANEVGGFAEWQAGFFNNKHLLNAGLRASVFMGEFNSFTLLEPRLNYHALLSEDFSVSASVTRMTQPIHRIANSGVGISFEIFAPSDAVLRPASSWQYSFGAARDFSWKGMKIGLKADAWFKSFQQLTEFKDGHDARTVIFLNTTDQLNELVTQGTGMAYGIDFSAELNHKRGSLTADYTLMQAKNRFEELNEGQYFASSTDIRNNLSITGSLKLSSQWFINGTWQYQTGRPITIPTSMIYPTMDIYNGQQNDYYNSFLPVYTTRNNFRMKDFHKMDLSFQYKYIAYRKYQASFSFGLYNVYNRANPYLYYIGLNAPARVYNYDTEEFEVNKDARPVLKSISIFTILPSFSWNIKF